MPQSPQSCFTMCVTALNTHEANANVFVVARNLFVVPEEAREVDHKWPDAIEVTASYSTLGSCSPT